MTIAPRPTGPKEGSLEWLFNQYVASREWARLAPATKDWRSRTMRRISETHGTDEAEAMTPRDGRALRAEFGEKGIKTLRATYAWAIEAGKLDENPLRDVKPLPRKSEGYRPWKIEHVRQFAEYHPKGTTAYLALAILLFTGLRRGDACRLGPQHVGDDGWITLATEKTGVVLEMPMLPQLRDAIDATRRTGKDAFIISQWGTLYTKESFGNLFGDWCEEAELPDNLSAHGLRKACGELLAELGASEHEIMAILAHASPRQSAHYTRGANRRKLAKSAARRMEGFTL